MRIRQRGAALILFATVLILGVAWYAVGALGKAPVANAEREVRTGLALQEAKRALLAYVVQYAARSDTAQPGQIPCPESPTLSAPGETYSCSPTSIVVGRFPWKTLGLNPVYDGEGEPLWLMTRGFRDPPINFTTPAGLTLVAGGVSTPVVAIIIAPGKPRNTASLAGALAGCTKQNQMVGGRNQATLAPANFIECGVATGSITSPGDPDWTNDRVIAISATEWADAIAPAIADRLQRQVAPAMAEYRSATSLTSWGTSFLPNASTIVASIVGSQPETNNLCGDVDMRAGMPPSATVASGTCSSNWTGGSATGLGSILGLDGCTTNATRIRCDFTTLLGGLITPRVTVTAPNIGYSFRRVNPTAITYQIVPLIGPAGPQVPALTNGYSGSVSSTTGSASFSFNIDLPALALADTVRVTVPHPTDALLADTRSAWWINNGWDRFTYYGVSQAATHDPGTSVCVPGGNVSGCLSVTGLPDPLDDKRLVLVLMGRQRAGTTQPSYDLSDYLEAANASPDVTYEAARIDESFNDRVAACPLTLASAVENKTICN